MSSGVYMIQSPSGGVYIGSSVRLKRRRTRHFSEMRNGYHINEALQRAWNKYDGDLKFVVLEYCENESLLDREQWWIDYIRSTGGKLYNARHTADSGGQPLQESTRRKISESMMGRKHSEQTKQKMRKPKSPEHAAAISRGRKGSNNIVWNDTEREKRCVALKKQWADGSRSYLADAVSQSWKNEVKRDERIGKMKASWTPERREKHRLRMVAQHAARDPVQEHMDRLNWILGV